MLIDLDPTFSVTTTSLFCLFIVEQLWLKMIQTHHHLISTVTAGIVFVVQPATVQVFEHCSLEILKQIALICEVHPLLFFSEEILGIHNAW